MLVKDIQKRIRINRAVSIAIILFSVVVVIVGFSYSYKIVQNSQKSIYILDNGVPVFAHQTDILLNRPVEYKAQVELFHRMFFTLPPDDKYIKENVEQSLYLIDDSGKKEYANLRENGFYNQVVSSSSMVTVQPDSIKVDPARKTFVYYGKEMINRRNSLVVRHLITKGNFKDIARTPNNTHGVLLTNWSIVDNSQISDESKYNGL